ncbi:MAG: hypothetical protein KAR54_02015 [Candidatus Pacebacteria bacterium]|nr:hypothetical protein [Candidatus Paceibacterota bacterium]
MSRKKRGKHTDPERITQALDNAIVQLKALEEKIKNCSLNKKTLYQNDLSRLRNETIPKLKKQKAKIA